MAVSGGYGAFLPGYQAHAESPAPTLHPQSEPFCVNGFCGASGEATARGVNLYEDMAAAC